MTDELIGENELARRTASGGRIQRGLCRRGTGEKQKSGKQEKERKNSSLSQVGCRGLGTDLARPGTEQGMGGRVLGMMVVWRMVQVVRRPTKGRHTHQRHV